MWHPLWFPSNLWLYYSFCLQSKHLKCLKVKTPTLVFKWLRRVSFNYKWKCTGSRICVACLTERSGIWTWKRWFAKGDNPPIQDLNVDDRHRLWTLDEQRGSCFHVTGSCLLIAFPLPQPNALHFRRPRNHVLDSCGTPPSHSHTDILVSCWWFTNVPCSKMSHLPRLFKWL